MKTVYVVRKSSESSSKEGFCKSKKIPTKYGKPVDEAKWNQAKDLAEEQGHSEDWDYVMGIYGRLIGMKKSITGGKADNLTLNDIAKMHGVSLSSLEKEHEMGMETEREHAKDKEKIHEITLDHLVDDPQYYTKLKRSGLADELSKSISERSKRKINRFLKRHKGEFKDDQVHSLADKLGEEHSAVEEYIYSLAQSGLKKSLSDYSKEKIQSFFKNHTGEYTYEQMYNLAEGIGEEMVDVENYVRYLAERSVKESMTIHVDDKTSTVGNPNADAFSDNYIEEEEEPEEILEDVDFVEPEEYLEDEKNHGSGGNNIFMNPVVYIMQKSAKWDRKYRLQGHKKWNGLHISIENRKGSVRRGVDPDGKEWKTKMKYAYGRIRGTEGVDGDHADIYIGPNMKSERVYVVHQNDPFSGTYDEDKIMAGFNTPEQAKKAYLSQYNRPDFFGGMTEFTVPELKEALQSCKGKRLEKKMEKSMKDKSLEEWKKKLIEYLEKSESGSVKKSVRYVIDSRMSKGKSYPVGEIREWNGKKYKKMPDKSWQLYYEKGEGRGRNQAVRNVIRKIENAKSYEELVDIIRNNRERFTENGKTAPIVKEFIAMAKRGKKMGIPGKTGAKKESEIKLSDIETLAKKSDSYESFYEKLRKLNIQKDEGVAEELLEKYGSKNLAREIYRNNNPRESENKKNEKMDQVKERIKESSKFIMDNSKGGSPLNMQRFGVNSVTDDLSDWIKDLSRSYGVDYETILNMVDDELGTMFVWSPEKKTVKEAVTEMKKEDKKKKRISGKEQRESNARGSGRSQNMPPKQVVDNSKKQSKLSDNLKIRKMMEGNDAIIGDEFLDKHESDLYEKGYEIITRPNMAQVGILDKYIGSIRKIESSDKNQEISKQESEGPKKNKKPTKDVSTLTSNMKEGKDISKKLKSLKSGTWRNAMNVFFDRSKEYGADRFFQEAMKNKGIFTDGRVMIVDKKFTDDLYKEIENRHKKKDPNYKLDTKKDMPNYQRILDSAERGIDKRKSPAELTGNVIKRGPVSAVELKQGDREFVVDASYYDLFQSRYGENAKFYPNKYSDTGAISVNVDDETVGVLMPLTMEDYTKNIVGNLKKSRYVVSRG